MDDWLGDQLGERPDPMDEVVEFGLPAVMRLAGVIEEDRAEAREAGSDDSSHDQPSTEPVQHDRAAVG
jgi:hypothetical protein